MAICIVVAVNFLLGQTIVAIDDAIKQETATEQTPIIPSDKIDSRTDGPTTTAPFPAEKRDAWADGFAGVTQGDVIVRVESVTTDFVNLTSFSGDGQSEKQLLQIEIRIENTSKTRKLDYAGWSSKLLGLYDTATVEDNLGNAYHPSWFAEDVVGQVGNTSIYPGQAITDRLVFEPPIDRAEFLKLQLPAAAFGGQGMLRLKVPVDGKSR